MSKFEFNRARAGASSRVLTRIGVCSALGLSMSWLPAIVFAQSADSQDAGQRAEDQNTEQGPTSRTRNRGTMTRQTTLETILELRSPVHESTF